MSKKVKIYAEVLETEALNQFYKAMSLKCNVQGALMPDAHTGYTLPIGAVIKSDGMIFPSYVGYDIGCGMCAVKLAIKRHDVDFNALRDYIINTIPVGSARHKRPGAYNFKPHTVAAEQFINLGLRQLGTLGGGNHFIEVGEGNDGAIWIIIHSGSRGFGYKIAEHYMKEAAIANTNEEQYAEEFERTNNWKEHNPEGFKKAKEEFIYRRVRASLNTNLEDHFGLPIDSSRGINYLLDMECALDFALENRKQMIARIFAFFSGVKMITFINRNHNHAELKDGYVIHRKGATHAEEGMFGVIPGNMRDGSFIVRGKGNPDSLYSSSHGAGRVLSRIKAKKTLDLTEFHKSMDGIITNHNDDTLDEAPGAYKNIFEVMNLQSDLVEVVDRVRPLLNIKG